MSFEWCIAAGVLGCALVLGVISLAVWLTSASCPNCGSWLRTIVCEQWSDKEKWECKGCGHHWEERA